MTTRRDAIVTLTGLARAIPALHIEGDPVPPAAPALPGDATVAEAGRTASGDVY